MDFLKKAAGEFSHGQGGQAQSGGGAQGGGAQAGGAAPGAGAVGGAGGAQKQDYGDKAFDFVSKKAGHDFAPGQDEKITDGIRGAYEKATGSKVDPKYSN